MTMKEAVPELIKDWSERISNIIHRPPYLAVAALRKEESRKFLNHLMGDLVLGQDVELEEKGYSLSLPFAVEYSTFTELQNQLLKLELIVVLGTAELAVQVEQEWKTKVILVSPSPEKGEFLLDSELCQKIYKALPFGEGTAFAMRCSDRDLKRMACEEYARITAFRAAFLGAIPIPVVDLAFLMPLQIAGVLKVASIYNHAFDKDRAKELIGVLGSRMFFRAASRSLSKLIPGLGSAVGASMASAGTYAILKAAGIYFEQGASLDPKEREVLKKVYDRAEKEGSDLFESEPMKEFRLIQLKYQSGAISKEEFEKKLEELGRK